MDKQFDILPVFDSGEIKESMSHDVRLQLVEVVDKNGTINQLVIIKSPQKTTEQDPQRKDARQLWMFPEYDHIKPEDFNKYTVVSKTHFEELLKRANQLSPQVDINTPTLPEKFELIDEYSRDRVVEVLSGGVGLTIYFSVPDRFYFLPSQDVMTPKLFDALKACETISIGHRLPMFPLVDFHGFRRITYDPYEQYYVEQSLVGTNRDPQVVEGYESLFVTNVSYYSSKMPRNN